MHKEQQWNIILQCSYFIFRSFVQENSFDLTRVYNSNAINFC